MIKGSLKYIKRKWNCKIIRKTKEVFEEDWNKCKKLLNFIFYQMQSEIEINKKVICRIKT